MNYLKMWTYVVMYVNWTSLRFYLDKDFHCMVVFPCLMNHPLYSHHPQIEELDYHKLEFFLEFHLHKLQDNLAIDSILPTHHLLK